MGFEITFLGTSGGPLENGNCAILIKPASLTYTEVIEGKPLPLFMFDAGSGWHALAETILNEKLDILGLAGDRLRRQLLLYEDSLPPHEYLGVPATRPFSGLQGLPLPLLRQIFLKVGGILISHPHMDHIQSIVLNLAGVAEAGEKTTIYASEFTTDALNKHIFNGVVWPDLVLLGFIDLYTVTQGTPFRIALNAYDVSYFEVSHGHVSDKGCNVRPYTSLAFLVCDPTDQAKILVFGDFEADSILGSQRNLAVWQHVAPYVRDGTLKCVILECSTCSRDPEVNLYGHMTPTHVMAEFEKLEAICGQGTNSGPLLFVKDLKVFFTHVKDTYDGKDPRRRILRELQELNVSRRLYMILSIATNGVLVVV